MSLTQTIKYAMVAAIASASEELPATPGGAWASVTSYITGLDQALDALSGANESLNDGLAAQVVELQAVDDLLPAVGDKIDANYESIKDLRTMQVNSDFYYTNAEDLLVVQSDDGKNNTEIRSWTVDANETLDLTAHWSTKDDNNVAKGFRAYLYMKPTGADDDEWEPAAVTRAFNSKGSGGENEDFAMFYRMKCEEGTDFKLEVNSVRGDQTIEAKRMQLSYQTYGHGYM